MTLPGQDIVAAAKIDDDFLLGRGLLEKTANDDVNSLEPQPVAPVDEGSSPLGLLDEVAEVVRLIRVVKAFNTAFRDDATTVCLRLNEGD